jgi:AcrR family transcriptional regulator
VRLRYTPKRISVAAVPALAATAAAGPRVGRPRDPQLDLAIREATLALLEEEGYPGTTIQAVARRAGVSAPSVYRRWNGKAELVEAAVFPSELVEPQDDGELGDDLIAYCRQILTYLAQPAVRAAVPGLLSEYHVNPAMWQRLVARTVTPMRESFEHFASRRGRHAVAAPDAVFELIVGALFTRAQSSGLDGADEFACQVGLVAAAALGAPPRRRGRMTPRRPVARR